MHRSDGMSSCEDNSPVRPSANVGVAESLGNVPAMPAGAAAAPEPDGAAAVVEDQELDEEVEAILGGPWDAAEETGACEDSPVPPAPVVQLVAESQAHVSAMPAGAAAAPVPDGAAAAVEEEEDEEVISFQGGP